MNKAFKKYFNSIDNSSNVKYYDTSKQIIDDTIRNQFTPIEISNNYDNIPIDNDRFLIDDTIILDDIDDKNVIVNQPAEEE